MRSHRPENGRDWSTLVAPDMGIGQMKKRKFAIKIIFFFLFH